ncbi:ATP-grasp domain-containing protein, partial [Gammaproteobacteria bacterium]|nr:ATP-grasp domain-containing protein [Gammaproteobacteria bacterium]
RVVFASSYLIYDPSLYQFSEAKTSAVLLNESDHIMPRNLTGAAKLAHEIELRFLENFKSHQFSSVCVRIFRGYGKNSRCVISRWIRDLLDGKTIDVYRPEGIFDYIYGTDTAEGLIRLANKIEVSGIINLGTGRSRRVSDVVNILKIYFPDMKENIISSDIPYEASQADIFKLKSYLGWSPEFDLERSIPEIIEHEKNELTIAKIHNSTSAGNVLVSSASAKIPMIRSLIVATKKIQGDCKVISGDINPNAMSFRFSDSSWEMPATVDCNLDEIISGCLERSVKFVFPTRDGELKFWSAHKAAFLDHGIHVIVSDLEAIENCLDKYAFYNFGLENDLPIIETSLDIEDLSVDLFVVKERFGAGSNSIGIKLDKKSAIQHALSLDKPIFQPYIDGIEFSADAWLTKGSHCKGVVLRRRNVVLNGESQVTTTFTNTVIEKKISLFAEALALQGPIVIQGFLIGDDIQIIECNSRFGGASTASIAAGLDSLFWSLIDHSEDNIDDHSLIRISGELQQVRIPSDEYIFDTSF